MADNHRIIAVDFDGCMCVNAWPEIGAPIEGTIRRLKAEQAAGSKLILWTCRTGELLEQALAWSAAQGVTFDAVNDHLPEMMETYDTDTRKIFATEYWDDRAVAVSQETEERQEILLDAVNTWGVHAQTDMMIEEAAELIKAIVKLRRAGDDNERIRDALAGVLEEMADVQIMLDQMKLIYGDCAAEEKLKIIRLRCRLEAEHGLS